MNSFSRFQERNKQHMIATNRANAKFILKGYPSIELTNSAAPNIKVAASVVNKQEKDLAYIYISSEDQPLTIGSVWEAKGLRWLITEEIVVIKDVNWRKYIALLCNVALDDFWGMFFGPEKSYINVALRQDKIIQSQQKPVLVLAAQGKILNIGDKIMLKGRPWLIQEKDDLSSAGIIYYSLAPTTMSKDVIEENKDKTVYIEKQADTKVEMPEAFVEGNIINVIPNVIFSLQTERGYFKTDNNNLEIINIDEKIVSLKLPFGVNNVNVEVKKGGRIMKRIIRKVE